MEFSQHGQNGSEIQAASTKRTPSYYAHSHSSVEHPRQLAQFPWRPYSVQSETQTFDSFRYSARQQPQEQHRVYDLPRVPEPRITQPRYLCSRWTGEYTHGVNDSQTNNEAGAQARVSSDAAPTRHVPLANGNSNSPRFMSRATRYSGADRSTSFDGPTSRSRPYHLPSRATQQSAPLQHSGARGRLNSEDTSQYEEEESNSDEGDSSSNDFAVQVHNASSRFHNDISSQRNVPRTGEPQNQKPSRYLREMDRREILARIDEGESQSSLAREYNVSRSAICNLNKKRDQVLARRHENPYAMHIKMNRTKSRSRSKLSASGILNGVFDPALDATPGVHKIQTRAIVLLLSTLLDKTTSDAIFARSADRLMRIFMEEATAFIQMRNKADVRNDHEATINSDETDGTLNGSPSAESNPRPLCAITMEQQHCPMLEHLHIVESDLPSGYARFHPRHPENLTQSGQDEEVRESPIVTLLSANLAESLDQQSVMLLDSFLYEDGYSTLDGVIEQVLARGAMEKHIAVLTLFISSEVAERISREYPDILILAVDIGGSSHELKKYDSVRWTIMKRYDT
ncbi:putative uracil phosphoribosyltransferase, partial [Globisporangium splendens]